MLQNNKKLINAIIVQLKTEILNLVKLILINKPEENLIIYKEN